MKLTAYHDTNGNIIGLAVSRSEDSVSAELRADTQPEVRISNVELPSEETLDFDNPARLNEGLSKLVENYRVDEGVLKIKSS
ncbi:MAG TPA: hypothetical protein DCY88_30680 [Cyanobacteria bacterium UBA11372]|nr:hypothetical protein [Cyanobacteria bacterium UBA11372]